MIGALTGKTGDSVWKTTWSQSTETAPSWFFGDPNGSTLHRHGNRNAELSSGHGCHGKVLPATWSLIEIYSQQNISRKRISHLLNIILSIKKQTKRRNNHKICC